MKPVLPPSSAVTPAVLDDDIVAALATGQSAPPLAPERAAQLKSRLFARIADDHTAKHNTVRADTRGWHQLLPGIERKVLHEAGETMSYLLRFAPGAVLPAHHHPIDEECVVLEGTLRIGSSLVLHPGDFHLAHQDMPHAAIVADAGAVIFLRGASPRYEHLV